jgi:Domain of unknown function (DUF2024)
MSIIMDCAVYDTYVQKKDGSIMHFDVIIADDLPHEKAIEYGGQYLQSVGQEGQKIAQDECQFCHIQQAPLFIEKSIREKGYWIQKMEGCPP